MSLVITSTSVDAKTLQDGWDELTFPDLYSANVFCISDPEHIECSSIYFSVASLSWIVIYRHIGDAVQPGPDSGLGDDPT